MIYVLCANPAWDRMLFFEDQLLLNAVNRVQRVMEVAGGKGVNVARAIKTIGGTSELLLFLGGWQGERFASFLKQEGLAFCFFPVAGETRVTTVLHEEGSGRHTVINEPGPLVPLRSTLQVERYLEEKLCSGDYLVLSGSLPRGVQRSWYAKLLALAQRKSAYSVLDTSGVSLRSAFQNPPFMVKPNVEEATELLGWTIDSQEDKLKAVSELKKRGVEIVVLSDGSRGLTVAWGLKRFLVSVEGSRVGAYGIGSGDTLVGAMVFGLERRWPVERILRFATACGLANTLRPGAGYFDPHLARVLQEKVVVRELEEKG